IGLSQDAYLDKILKRYRMDGSKRGAIPTQVDCHLDKSQCAESKDDKARMQNVPYASASSKQSTTEQHAAEAEYIAAAEAAKETVGIKKFVDELGVIPSNNYPIEMNCDNTAAISMAKEPGI
nr:retrotransposon protein, putative, Ty1-copia subclass [Tanacetum cinerariifolium]